MGASGLEFVFGRDLRLLKDLKSDNFADFRIAIAARCDPDPCARIVTFNGSPPNLL